MTSKKFTLRAAIAAGATCVLVAGPVGFAAAEPGNDNGHHHCGGNSGQGQGNQCEEVVPPGDQDGDVPVPPGDNPDDTANPGGNDDPGDAQTPPDNGSDDQGPPPGDTQTPPGENSGGEDVPADGEQDDGPPPGDEQTPPENNGGDDQNPDEATPPGDDQGPPPGDTRTPPGENSGGDNHGTPPGNSGGDHHGNPGGDHGHQGPKPGGDGHDSHPPKDGHHDVINVDVGVDLTVVVAPNITIHFGDVTVNNYTIYQVNNVTTNNIVVDNRQYNEVTVYSVDTDVYYLGYYDDNSEFHCTGYYHDDVKTPEQANIALANNKVVKQVPDAEVVTGFNPVAATSSFWEDNLKWEVPLGIAIVAVAGYGLVTFVRRRNHGGNEPTDLPGASA